MNDLQKRYEPMDWTFDPPAPARVPFASCGICFRPWADHVGPDERQCPDTPPADALDTTKAMRHVCHECRNRHNVDPIHHLPRLTDWCSICSHRAEGTTLAVVKGRFGNWHVLKEQPTPPAERPTPITDAVAAIEGNWDTKALRMGHHARRLERQLAEARLERDNAISDWRQADTDSIRAIHERNEARELIAVKDRSIAAANQTIMLNNELMRQATDKLAEVREQRDRLADALRAIRQMTRNDERCSVCTDVYHSANAALATLKGQTDEPR